MPTNMKIANTRLSYQSSILFIRIYSGLFLARLSGLITLISLASIVLISVLLASISMAFPANAAAAMHQCPLMTKKLINAFGGQTLLNNIESISFNLSMTKAGTTNSQHFYMNFKKEFVAKSDDGFQSAQLASQSQRLNITKGQITPLSEREGENLIANMKSNFLYFLTSPNFELVTAPLTDQDCANTGRNTRFQMRAKTAAPIDVTLAPDTGKITKVLITENLVSVEYDYRTHKSGLIWPARFTIKDGDTAILEGQFTDIIVNPKPPAILHQHLANENHSPN